MKNEREYRVRRPGLVLNRWSVLKCRKCNGPSKEVMIWSFARLTSTLGASRKLREFDPRCRSWYIEILCMEFINQKQRPQLECRQYFKSCSPFITVENVFVGSGRAPASLTSGCAVPVDDVAPASSDPLRQPTPSTFQLKPRTCTRPTALSVLLEGLRFSKRDCIIS